MNPFSACQLYTHDIISYGSRASVVLAVMEECEGCVCDVCAKFAGGGGRSLFTDVKLMMGEAQVVTTPKP